MPLWLDRSWVNVQILRHCITALREQCPECSDINDTHVIYLTCEIILSVTDS